MKVLNKSFDGTDTRYKGHLATTPWTLCIGAGVSFGLVPTWYELTKNVVNDAFGWTCSADDFASITEGTKWSLDSLLQGASNKLDMDGAESGEFYNLLEKHLYRSMLDDMQTPLLQNALKKGLSNPRNLSKYETLAILDYFESKHSKSTLFQLADFLSKARQKEQLPVSVINFNADTLLHLLIEVKYIAGSNSGLSWEQPAAQFVKSFRGVQTSSKDIIRIHHCHGAISPNENGLKKNKDSRQNIVFRESEYLEIAGTASTWAQTLCLYHAQNSKFLIIGHSLSDPNIRKWLAWSHQNHLKELSQLLPEDKKNDAAVSPRHIWINVKPSDSIQQELMEISLLHIGVRICWIDSWEHVGTAMENLLSL